MNFRKSSRLTSKVSKKRMNLPDVPRKNRRKNWKEKIKREDEDAKRNRDRNLDIIRRRLLRELTRKLAEKRARRFSNKARIRRSPRRNIIGKSKLVPKNRKNLNEKIRIIYSMKRKNSKDKHSQKHGEHFENSKNRTNRSHDISAEKSEKNPQKNPTKRHKRNENLKNDDFLKDSEESDRIGEQKHFDILAIPDGQESFENNTEKDIFSKHDMANNDSIFYSHMLDMEKELLKKSNSRSASSSLKERNAKFSKCTRISKDVCEGKYERMKKLVHAGVHYLLRRFDDCENCKIENAPLVSSTSVPLIKKKREDDESMNVENMAKKIINFASTIDSHNGEKKKAGRADGKFENLIEKFGIDELGLKSEKDKKSLAALINEIVDVQKSVNETLEIIKSRSSKSEIQKIQAQRSTKNSTTARNNNKKQTKNKKKDGERSSKKIRSKKQEKDNQKNGKKFNEYKWTEKNVKKSRNVIEKKNPTPEDKKKLESRSSPEGHLDEIGQEMRAILTEESDQDPKESTSKDSEETSNTSRKVRHLEMINNDVYSRYARDIDHTNIANFGKYRIRRVRSIVWNRAHLSPEDREETILENLPQFLDQTNISSDYNKNKKKNDTSEKTSVNSTTPEATTRMTLTQVISTKRASKIAKKSKSEKFLNHFENLEKNKKIETKPRNQHEMYHHPRKKREKSMIRMASISKNEKKLMSVKRGSTISPSLAGASKWKLNDRVNLAPAERANANTQLSHFSVQRKLQSSPKISGSRSPKRKTKKSKKRKKVGKRSIKKSSKLAEKNVSRHNEKRESQTVIPMDNGHLRVKYIYRDVTEQIPNRTVNFLENHDRKVQGIAKETQNFRNEQKAVFASVPVTEHRVTNNNCVACICDIVETIDQLKNILTARGDTLMKIKNYECPKYEEIGDEIVLFSSGIIGDILPKSRRDLAEAKGMTYVKPEDLEDVLRGGSDYENNDNDLMSFPGNDLYVPCNRDGDDVTWLTSISKPNYSWTRDDGLPVSGAFIN